jgi:hypothetical protein
LVSDQLQKGVTFVVVHDARLYFAKLGEEILQFRLICFRTDATNEQSSTEYY